MFKTLVEYITEVEAVSNPEGTILSVIQLIKKTAEGSGDATKFSMPRFLNHLKNAGLDIDYAGFKGYYDASPSIQNSIGQFTEKEISFGSDEDSESSETMGKPEGKMPPAEKVAQMANRAVKARESASDSLKAHCDGRNKKTNEDVDNNNCPKATQDIKLNTENREKTIKEYDYGPLNFDFPGDYWEEIADYWDTTEEAAMNSLCGNCVAFDISPKMKDCMPGETSDGDGELGYCWMHHFKCHSARTCKTWAKGGPITDNDVSDDWNERAFPKEEKFDYWQSPDSLAKLAGVKKVK